MLAIVEKCLSRQTFPADSYEWIVGSPQDFGFGIWVKDPPKKDWGFYTLNATWNKCLKEAQGELFVSIVDGLYFPPDTLEWLWRYYVRYPMKLVSFAGHHYDKMENGKPEHLIWTDPKVKNTGEFEEIAPWDFELCIASLPMKGVRKIGGFDEIWDRFPGWSEKDLACRLTKIGYKCYIDHGLQFRAIHHPRLEGDKWHEKFPESSKYFMKCLNEIQENKRLKLNYL